MIVRRPSRPGVTSRGRGERPGFTAARGGATRSSHRPRRRARPDSAAAARVARGPVSLYLTFDDGPSPRETPGVLAALHRAQARATFFVLGEGVRRHPGLVRAALAAGHRVEPHADRHVSHAHLTEAAIEADARAVVHALGGLGVRPRWWRTPWGTTTAATHRVAERLGLTLVGWDADTHDWRGDPPGAMLRVLRRDVPLGGVVLAHDALGPGARREDCADTVAFVRAAAAWAARRGLPLDPLPDPAVGPLAPAAGPATRSAATA